MSDEVEAFLQQRLDEAQEDITNLSRWSGNLEAQAAVYRQALIELVSLKDEVKQTDQADYERRKPLAWQAARDALSSTAGQSLLDRQRELEEALRSMVTVYVGVIKDHFDTTTNNHVLEEPPVKRARILLGLEPAPAERKGVEPG